MTYIIKRKFRGILGDDVDSADMTSFIQHVQTSAGGISTGGTMLDLNSLTVNHLVVKRTLKIPARTDGYK